MTFMQKEKSIYNNKQIVNLREKEYL